MINFFRKSKLSQDLLSHSTKTRHFMAPKTMNLKMDSDLQFMMKPQNCYLMTKNLKKNVNLKEMLKMRKTYAVKSFKGQQKIWWRPTARHLECHTGLTPGKTVYEKDEWPTEPRFNPLLHSTMKMQTKNLCLQFPSCCKQNGPRNSLDAQGAGYDSDNFRTRNYVENKKSDHFSVFISLIFSGGLRLLKLDENYGKAFGVWSAFLCQVWRWTAISFHGPELENYN